MQKELNLEIFGEAKAESRKPQSRMPQDFIEPSFLNTDRQIFEVKTQVTQMALQLEKLQQTLSEQTKTNQVRNEKYHQSIHRLEQSHNGLAQEVGQKLVQMSQKLSERRNMDIKIQEMVDRHNNVLKSFEVRMNHLQKLLQDKEAQLIEAHGALNDAKMEISRLKRM